MSPSTTKRRTTTRRRTNLTAGQVVADQVRDRRDRRGMSQQELADKIGESQSTIARIESGKRAITVDDVFKLAWALDVAPVHLLGAGFRGDSVPITKTLQLEPAVARGWIRGKIPLKEGNMRAFLFENIPDDEADELFSAARIRDWLETRLSLAELSVAGEQPGPVNPDATELRTKIKAQIDALFGEEGGNRQ